MSNRLANYLVAGALASALVLASPALAFKGGGGMGGGGGHAIGGGFGGGHAIGGGFGGAGLGPRSGGMVGPVFGGARFVGTGLGPRSGGLIGPHVGGARFFGAPGAFRPQFAVHRAFFHHRFRRFAFIGFGFPYYADYGYDYCWRRVWTQYGLQWVNVCYDYGY